MYKVGGLHNIHRLHRCVRGGTFSATILYRKIIHLHQARLDQLSGPVAGSSRVMPRIVVPVDCLRSVPRGFFCCVAELNRQVEPFGALSSHVEPC